MKAGRRLLLVVFAAVSVAASAGPPHAVEFRDRPIADILLALGELYSKSILSDDTVTGRASCYLHESDLDRALEVFLPAHHLYWWREGDIYRVSRIRVLASDAGAGFDIDANDADTEALIRRYSETTGVPIISGVLSGQRITLHARGIETKALMELVEARYPDIVVTRAGSTYLLVRTDPNGSSASSRGRRAAERALTVNKNGFSLNAEHLTFGDAVGALMNAAGKQAVFLNKTNKTLRNLRLEKRSFDEMLTLLLHLGSCGSTRVAGTYVVYDIGDSDVLRQIEDTVVVPLTYLSAESLQTLMPSAIAGTSHIRIAEGSNSVVLTGKPEEVEPIEKFLRRLDRPPENRRYFRFDLSFLEVKDFLRLLPTELAAANPMVVPGGQSFVLPLSKEQRDRLQSYIATVDRPQSSVPVVLKNVRVKDLLENLPPGISAADIRATADPSTFFFVGDQRRRNLLRGRLAVLDRPRRQIRYELLVVQHRRGESSGYEIGLTSTMLSGGERTTFLGTIGKLLSLRFDIVSAFGYLFALNLNAELATARARILADTTLNGISGEQISFRNTDTYRYRDAVVNPDTGRLDPTGVVREITSGLIIGIDGWVSGSDVITMNISSTVSARGADTTGSANALPSTTEKLITTHVRTKSGTPVALGGLLERTSETRVDKVPLLGDLPLVGRLFQKRVTTTQDSELSIYILPHVEKPSNETASLETKLRRIYDRLVAGSADG